MFGFVTLAYALVNLVDLFERGTPDARFVLQSHFLAGWSVLLLVLPRFCTGCATRRRRSCRRSRPGKRSCRTSRTCCCTPSCCCSRCSGLLTVWLGGRGIGIPARRCRCPRRSRRTTTCTSSSKPCSAGWASSSTTCIGLHIAGALWHHFVRKDITLRRIL
jgi:cytochrome b561